MADQSNDTDLSPSDLPEDKVTDTTDTQAPVSTTVVTTQPTRTVEEAQKVLREEEKNSCPQRCASCCHCFLGFLCFPCVFCAFVCYTCFCGRHDED